MDAVVDVVVPDMTGASGTLGFGVTEEDTVEGIELPTEFLAVSVNVYAVPFVNPVTTAVDVEAPVTVTGRVAGVDTTV
jgi:hypothetical protein